MDMTMRWYGEQDPVSLKHLRQVPALSGVVSALTRPAGEAWPLNEVLDLKTQVEAAGLRLRVIESIPVHESVKLGLPERDEYIQQFVTSLRHVAQAHIEVVCYNFMPVFDWTRTDLAYPLPDGSTTLVFREDPLSRFDPAQGTQGLPGWSQGYSGPELQALIKAYQAVDSAKLREHLRYFLQAVVPVAEEVGVKLAIHPDDPPWPLLGLPRVVSTADDLRAVLKAYPSAYSGLTFCTGSLGARADNNLVDMAREFAGQIHFLHARNVQRHAARDFDEVPHVSRFGNIRLSEVVTLLAKLRPGIPYRPDHGRMIWGETGRPGYGLYDRALGATYLQGLIDAATLEPAEPAHA